MQICKIIVLNAFKAILVLFYFFFFDLSCLLFQLSTVKTN